MTKRAIAFAVTISLVGSFFVAGRASAAISRRCAFELADLRVDASKILIAAEKNFIHDVLGFNDTMFHPTSDAEVKSEGEAVGKQIGKHFAQSLIQLVKVTKEAGAELDSGECGGATRRQVSSEARFYIRTGLQLLVFTAQALSTLRRNVAIALKRCCS